MKALSMAEKKEVDNPGGKEKKKHCKASVQVGKRRSSGSHTGVSEEVRRIINMKRESYDCLRILATKQRNTLSSSSYRSFDLPQDASLACNAVWR